MDRERRELLFSALVGSFTPDDLHVLLEIRLGEPMAVVTGGGALPKVVTDVITYFENRDRIDELIGKAAEARPGNKALRRLAGEIVAAPADYIQVEQQQALAQQVPDLDPEKFRADSETLERRVCLIEMTVEGDGPATGTGFLVGPDLVLTAYHVIRPVLDFQAKRQAPVLVAPQNVHFCFDYKRLRDGRTLGRAVIYDLHPDPREWLKAWRPDSPYDVQPEPKPDPDPEQLDFALVRLDAPAGEHAIGLRQEPEPRAEKRGWIDLTQLRAQLPGKNTPLLILHYPLGMPLKLTPETQSIIGLNGNGTRLKHRTNTGGGSSGAPCFDAWWNLVALHQGMHKAPGNDYNQAVPIARIAQAIGGVKA